MLGYRIKLAVAQQMARALWSELILVESQCTYVNRFANIIDQLEIQRSTIDRAISALREVGEPATIGAVRTVFGTENGTALAVVCCRGSRR
jgi:hypothetical protein